MILARYEVAVTGGHYFGPVIARVPAPDAIRDEVFGPVLHVYVYQPGELPSVVSRFAALGYGLTLGIHSRIDGFVREIVASVPAGNVYVNRSMTGAVVGVQPFGGVGRSGTGPKAGGPDALVRYAQERVITVNVMAQGGDPELLQMD
jgi:RHH-type proline utilization regulon transcriptional repressor/proline dehydrogenase/delta 1-pyrroline-5-carboxylate dehydrogenase